MAKAGQVTTTSLSRRGVFAAAACTIATAATPAAAVDPWAELIADSRASFPGIAAACEGAKGAGYCPDDVHGIGRILRGPAAGRRQLCMKDGRNFSFGQSFWQQADQHLLGAY